MRAGFAEVDITPPLGSHKIGWLKEIVADTVLDPLSARIAVFESCGERIGFIQLDTLSVRWTQVDDIRRRIEGSHGFPGGNIMVAATHNHCGPAMANCGDVPRDDAYVETLMQKLTAAFGQALENAAEAEVGLGRTLEYGLSHNRRIVMRDGTASTHGSAVDPEALCIEGPMDPEVAVLAVRTAGGEKLGGIVNFACHPCHNGGATAFSGGYPAALARAMKAHGWPVTLFLNGACGDVHTTDPITGGGLGKDEVGWQLACDVIAVIGGMEFRPEARLSAASATLQLPYRTVAEDEIKGTVGGAQRFIDPEIYDRGMDALMKRIEHRKTQPAEVQALGVDEWAFVSIPAEYFVEHGLRIKERAYPRHALVVSCANGMIGYVPTAEAFRRGGYETTFAASSRMAPEAGDTLADTAVELLQGNGNTEP